MYLLNYGVTYVDKGIVLTVGRDIGQIVPTPIWGALVDTGQKLVLVDTGMNPVHIEDPDATFRGTEMSGKINPVVNEENLALNQIKSCGYSPDDVSIVINTHLHFDHCGGNLFFPGAEFVVQRGHYQWAIQNNSSCPRRDFDLKDTKWRFVDGDCELLPGVRLITTPGHVPGHQSVVINLRNSGPAIIASDAVFLRETMEPGAPITAHDKDIFYQSIEKIKDLCNNIGGTLYVSHEQALWDTWKHAPQYYD